MSVKILIYLPVCVQAVVAAESELQRARAAGDEDGVSRAECAAIAAVMAAQFGPTRVEGNVVHVQVGRNGARPGKRGKRGLRGGSSKGLD